MKPRPLFSVIIATKNCQDTIAPALESVRAQRFDNFECIVIDGGSTDETISIIKSHEQWLGHWLSEPDTGIADAFNKGIIHSRGDVLYFLGADDQFHDPDVLQDVASALKRFPRPWFIYGDLYYKYQNTEKLIHKNFTLKKFRKYNCIPHQAMFLERDFFDRYNLFDTEFRYAMDYEHIARFIRRTEPAYLARPIARMGRSGQSTDIFATHREMDVVRLKYGFASPTRIFFDNCILRGKYLVAKCLGLNW